MTATEHTYRGIIDFRHGTAPLRRLAFNGFDHTRVAYTIDEVIPTLKAVEAACNEGFTAMGFVAYEAAGAFDPALQTYPPKSGLPLVFFGLSKHPEEATPKTSPLPEVSAFTPAWTFEDYLTRFNRVQQHIYDGETYQINLTFPLHAHIEGKPDACYDQLRSAQHSDYCGMLTGPEFSIISVSPELFFERRGTSVVTRPMKGTRKRGRNQQEDTEIANGLKASEKDRAENVMIVDMLRNDLGHIAKTGSVQVPELFAVEKYPTVWQMTSTITAEVDAATTLTDMFSALFPCGSVTGAPKVKTMELITGLESGPRGIYCGAFGIVFPNGDCTFNVPIRTMTIQGSTAEYPVGSGLVTDSIARDEYDECLVKVRVLDRGLSTYKLLETLRYDHDGFLLLDGHLQRLTRSADLLGFEVDEQAVRRALQATVGEAVGPLRVRLLVADDGTIEIETALLPVNDNPIRVVKLADEPVDPDNRFLYHKTTRRDVYDRERDRLGDADDALLFNIRGELTESTIANVALERDGVWYTPPVSCGLLPGVMREALLNDGTVTERILTLDDLHTATGIRLMNSVRGFWDVKLIGES